MSHLLLTKETAEELATDVIAKRKPSDFWRRQAEYCEKEVERAAERYQGLYGEKAIHFAPEIMQEFMECECMHILETLRRVWAYRALAEAVDLMMKDEDKEEDDE
jgi:hypothetical protein